MDQNEAGVDVGLMFIVGGKVNSSIEKIAAFGDENEVSTSSKRQKNGMTC